MLDMFSPELRRNPYPMYQMMRQSQPVMYIEQLNIWSVFQYEDVRTVLSDHARFSSQFGQSEMPDANVSTQARMNSSLISSDPPRQVGS